jgi:hypothetical protein
LADSKGGRIFPTLVLIVNEAYQMLKFNSCT